MGMFGNALSGWHLLIIVLVVLLLFGATKLPALAKGLGESIRILKKETRGEGEAPTVGAERDASASTPAANDTVRH